MVAWWFDSTRRRWYNKGEIMKIIEKYEVWYEPEPSTWVCVRTFGSRDQAIEWAEEIAAEDGGNFVVRRCVAEQIWSHNSPQK